MGDDVKVQALTKLVVDLFAELVGAGTLDPARLQLVACSNEVLAEYHPSATGRQVAAMAADLALLVLQQATPGGEDETIERVEEGQRVPVCG